MQEQISFVQVNILLWVFDYPIIYSKIIYKLIYINCIYKLKTEFFDLWLNCVTFVHFLNYWSLKDYHMLWYVTLLITVIWLKHVEQKQLQKIGCAFDLVKINLVNNKYLQLGDFTWDDSKNINVYVYDHYQNSSSHSSPLFFVLL